MRQCHANYPLKKYIENRNAIFIYLLIVIIISVKFNIPVFRQIVGFAFLFIILGIILVNFLKLNLNNAVEKFVLPIGIGISCIMFFGFFINYICPLFEYNMPLSNTFINSLFITILSVFVFAVYFKKVNICLTTYFNYFWLTSREKMLLILPIMLPAISVVGVYLMNIYSNNVLLMILFFLISIYSIFLMIYDPVLERIYPHIISLFSISIIIIMGLRSSHIIGVDVHSEYYIFQQTVLNERWQIFMNSTIDSCLSISILPTFYQLVLNINSEYIFKILYPIFFSISPLIIYNISNKFLDKKYAFLASLFFMSQLTFMCASANPRTTIAILFFLLSIMVLTSCEFNEASRKFLLIIFMLSSVVSHYSTTYIFFLIISLTWIGSILTNRILTLSTINIYNNSLDHFSSFFNFHLTIGMLLIFIICIFVWYSQITGYAFMSGVSFIMNVFESLNNFFILESRGEGVSSAFGYGSQANSMPQKITFIFSWMSILFIAFGILSTILDYISIFGAKKCIDTSGFITRNINIEFLILSIVCSSILVLSVALPGVFIGYSIDRAFCQIMGVLSTFFAIGGIKISGILHIKKPFFIILIVLIPYFLCASGFISEIYNIPSSINLNSSGDIYDEQYVYDQEVFASKWLSSFYNNKTNVYSDLHGICRLISQGLINIKIHKNQIDELLEKKIYIHDGYIYLRHRIIFQKIPLDKNNRPKMNIMDDYNRMLMQKSKIYSNNGSAILL